jgi:tetratricopeptide (TPR) repeat protein
LLPNTIARSEEAFEVLLGLKRYDEADALMQERGKRNRHDRFYLLALAQSAEQRGDMEEALKRWQVARDRVRDTVDTYHGCARCLVALGRLDEAETHWNRAILRSPRNTYSMAGRARISDLRQDWVESLVRWKPLALEYHEPQAYAAYANALIELGRAAEAEAFLEEPSYSLPRALEIARLRAHLAARRGDLPVACDRWALVRATVPSLSEGYHHGAECLAKAERHVEADAVMQSAMQRFPEEAWPVRRFAALAHDRQDWPEAVSRWEALRQRFPEDADGYWRGAEALRGCGRDAEAAALHRG